MFNEPYPSFPEEWDNRENTLYREFYLRSYPDFEILHDLVKTHMSDKGNEGVTKYRLMFLLKEESNRAFYLRHQQHSFPKTWRLRWFFNRLRKTYHRHFKTKKFKQQLELCRIADNVIKNWKK